MSATQTQTINASSLPLKGSDTIPSGPVNATLNFYAPPSDGSAPYNWVEKQPEGTPQSNFGIAALSVPISDLRGHESEFTLDRNAFLPIASHQLMQSSKADFSSDDLIKETYYPEVESLLLSNLPNSKRVFIFDHTVRRAMPGSNREPVMRTHIDQTPESAAERVRLHMGDEAAELLQGRFRLVNVWRPLNGPVESFPLAVADSNTTPDEAVVPVEHRYPHRTGYTAGIKHVDSMRWYYWSGMSNEERLLLQCFDSESGSRVPHSAFAHPKSTAESKPRESIEVRALIFG